MNTKVSLSIVVSCFLLISKSFCDENNFRINQVGYYPAATKIVPILSTQDSTFELLNDAGGVVFNGKLSVSRIWKGDTIKSADFTSFSDTGVYKLRVIDKGVSYPFHIGNRSLEKVATAALKSFYFQRCSMELDQKYANEYARKAGHPDTICRYHPLLEMPTTAILSSPKGWYDAGDYGKYIVNAGITVGTLLELYENFPDCFADNSLNIPESGNKINDLLDEVKYELDWMKTMQDSSGKVFHKLTSPTFCGFVMPDKDKLPRYVIGVSSQATFDFAAVMAMAGRIYHSIDSVYANDCIQMAQKAWDWGRANPKVFFTNPSDVSTGSYGNGDSKDEMIWSTTELFITTHDPKYKAAMDSVSLLYSSTPTWSDVGSLAALSLATIKNDYTSAVVDSVKKSIIEVADITLNEISRSAYRIPNDGFAWGSNSSFANYGVCLMYAYILTKDSKYALGAAETADYLLGKNATGYSFVTGYGSKTPMHPHHRPSEADTVEQPVPGFLVGGPNGTPKSYVDSLEKYEQNEVAINWNAPAVFLFASLDQILPQIPISVKPRIAIKSIHNSGARITADQKLHIYLHNPVNSWIKLYDLKGKLIQDMTNSVKALPKGNADIKLNLLHARGVYVLRCNDGSSNFTFTVTKVQ